MSKIPRIVLGPRARDGQCGFFISPPGINADTAADSQLILNVSSKVSQLLFLGRATNGQLVALGLARSPFVMLTTQWDFSSVIGHTLGPGPSRPSPPFLVSSSPSTATINGNGASMTLTLVLPGLYAVYNSPFT
jgi:hypothetical protein